MTANREQVFWSALIVSGCMHLLVIWQWHRGSTGADVHSNRPDSPLEVHMLMPPVSTPLAPHGVSGRYERHHDVALPERSSAPEPSLQQSPAEESPVVPIEPAPRSADDMIEAAKRDIRSIDRELKLAFPGRPAMKPRAPASLSSELEKGIAAAGLPRGVTTQEVTTADGRRVTKVMTPTSTYCILGRRPGAGIAENELSAFVTTTCLE